MTLRKPHSVPTHPRWVGADRITVPARSIIWPRMTFSGNDATFLGRAGATGDGYPIAVDVDAPSSLLEDAPGVTHWGDRIAYSYGLSFIVAPTTTTR